MCRFYSHCRRRLKSLKSNKHTYHEYSTRNFPSDFILYVFITFKKARMAKPSGPFYNQSFNFRLLLHFLNFFDHDLQSINAVANDSNVRNLKDWSVFIFVNCYDIVRTCNTGNMLSSAGNTTCNV